MDAPTWTPGPDPWARRRRQALAEQGLEHLDRMRDAIHSHARARRRAVARLIRDAGGDPDADPPPDVDGGDDEWRAEAARMIRKQRATFEAVAADGHAPLPAARREIMLAAGVPASQLHPWPPTEGLKRRVADARAWADRAEDAAP